MILETDRKCPSCGETTLLVEMDIKTTSDLTRQDLHGRRFKAAHINDDGTITHRICRHYVEIRVYVEPHLPDSKVNHVLELSRGYVRKHRHSLYATCPNCGGKIGVYSKVPNHVAELNQPYALEVIPFDLIPKDALIEFDPKKEDAA